MPDTNPIAFQHYRELPAEMFKQYDPMSSPAPSLIELNENLLDQLGIDANWFRSDEGLSILAGNSINSDNPPIAMAYSGHQFGNWVPLLGDGRAHMLGQLKTAEGELLDVQLKGSGRTPFSRGGDGRATLGSVIREYLVSEAMAALGIPTTRSIAMIGTGEDVLRERIFPGATLARSAASHIRVGSFQYAASSLDSQGVQALADFVIAKHFPELAASSNPYLALLESVIDRQASLVSQWMLVGFIHGVMNTDNMSIVGETIDYGPCAFMDEFNPEKVFSSIDRNGRYAWDQQPNMAYWNLTRFAETLLPLLNETPEDAETLARETLGKFIDRFREQYQAGLVKKFGLSEASEEAMNFVNLTMGMIAEDAIDFTVFFDQLTHATIDRNDALVVELFDNKENADTWLSQWQTLRTDNPDVIKAMRFANPAVIARNHRVEEAINAAVDNGDYKPFHRLCRVLANPFEVDPADRDLQTPPQPEERVTQTFCGT